MMEYNTSRNHLVLPEYGRHVQKLVEHALTIEDDEKRNAVAREIVNLMGLLNPQLKNVEDFKHLLWDHLFIISDWKLKVDSPYPIPEKEVLFAKPEHIGYPGQRIRLKHYGRGVEAMIDKAVEMDDPEKQQEFAILIANYMKMVYNNNSKDGINDESIRADFEKIAEGRLSLPEDANLDMLIRSTRSSNSNNRSNNNRGKGRSNKGGNKNRRKNYRKN